LNLAAIQAALLPKGFDRGASTWSQQTVKNVYLWHGRHLAAQKALEARHHCRWYENRSWTKRRKSIEVYLKRRRRFERRPSFGYRFAAAQH